MRELAATLASWRNDGRRFAMATVVHSFGSAPRTVGSAMAIRDDGLIAGSVSGGCVEGATAESAMRVLQSGVGERLAFGSASEAALFEVGLSCGGQIELWVEPFSLPDLWDAFLNLLRQRVALERVVAFDPGLPAWGFRTAESDFGASELLSKPEDRRFSVRLPIPPRLVLVGAVHIAVALVPLARTLGFETVVIDPRAAFARKERFPTPPDQILELWPEEAFASMELDGETHVVALSHDAKIDSPALAMALKSPSKYVGALGSRKTQADRREYLMENGVTEGQIERLYGPVGLDIGAGTPEEIALAILGQIVQVCRKGPTP